MRCRPTIVTAIAVVVTATAAFAASHQTSLNVALIPNTTGAADQYGDWGGGYAGRLVATWFSPPYNITVVHPNLVTSPNDLAAYDTVILYQYCNVNTIPGPSFTTPLIQWLQQYSGKLIIWDSDSCPNATTYGWLAPLGATFERWSPGQTGARAGSLTILDNNGLGSMVPGSPYYLNTSLMVSQTDAVGDLNVVNENTVSPVWCAHMRGVNVYNRSGFGHMYTKIGGLIGAPDALIIYCGLDTDYINATAGTGGNELRKMMLLELAHGWGPPGSPEVADLNCQVPVGNLALTPATAQNEINRAHTVTATVTTYDFSTGQTVPVPGITVTFLVTSGPNTGTTGTGVSDAQGQTTFTYVGTVVGNDVIQATATVNGVLKTATAEKEWVKPANAPPVALCQNVTVTTDPGACVATVTAAQVDAGSSDPDGDPLTYVLSPAGPYPRGVTPVTLTVSDSKGGSDGCQATVTVVDITPPSIVCPAPITQNTDPGQCTAIIDYAATASDNCAAGGGTNSPAVVVRCAPPSHSVFPIGSTTVHCTATDRSSNSVSCSFTVTVVNSPPTASAGGSYSVTEGGSVDISASGSDPEGGPLSYAWDLDGDGIFETAGQSLTLSAATLDGPSSYTLTVRVTDQCGLTAESTTQLNVLNLPPTITGVTGPTDPVQVGTPVTLTVTYTDPCPADTHTVTFVWEDGTTSTVNGSGGSASGTHTYSGAGIFAVGITVTDDDGGVATTVFEYVVVFDPNGGFVTGGGWIESPAGAYVPDPTLVGRANFGFVSKYQKGATTPVGQTEFQFKAGDLNFHSDVYQWLVVAGPRAQYKGTGTVNGAPGYGFFLVAVDGAIAGGGGVDKFRIKIWDTATSAILYDNQPGEGDNSSLTTAISGGSIVIHTK